MKKSTSGFTIVELLIVVVVIGILAAIVIVAYNGITQEARQAKTVSAVNAWIKAIKLYNTSNGGWPVNSCLGDTTTYVGEGGQCWDSTSWTVSSTFLSSMQPHIGSYPEPDTTNLHASGASGGPKRGALFYNASTTDKQIYIMLANENECPNISIEFVSRATYGNGVRCIYKIN
jgi:prepilin-type N-terminal cleavage/methylation domain-containing protein